MSELITKADNVEFIDPRPPVIAEVTDDSTSFSIEVAGFGQLTGLIYTVPAHTSGTISATLKTAALTSDDVKNLNDLAMSMLSASKQEEVKNFIETSASASANISLWSYFFGGNKASADYKSTQENMMSLGLTEAQIDKLMDAFLERAKQMSTVTINFNVNNTNSDYSVSGDIYLFTVSGTIKTKKDTAQYRMFPNNGSAGGPPPSGGGAPSAGTFS